MDDVRLLAKEHAARAATSPQGRSSELILHDGPLRHTLIALRAGAELSEHNPPAAASLQVLSGRVILTSPAGDQELTSGQLQPIPHHRHGLTATDDSVILLTTVVA